MITMPKLQEFLDGAGSRRIRRVEQPNPTRIMYLAEA